MLIPQDHRGHITGSVSWCDTAGGSAGWMTHMRLCDVMASPTYRHQFIRDTNGDAYNGVVTCLECIAREGNVL